jgi:Holliday junction resolvase RusA-like endonuclease
MSIEFTIPGKAHPQGRPRFTRQGRTYTATADKEWHEKVVDSWERKSGRRILNGPYAVTVRIYEARPKSHRTASGDLTHAGKKADAPTRGDLDNYVKGIVDALVRREVIPDDRYMVELEARKAWLPTEGEGYTYVCIAHPPR